MAAFRDVQVTIDGADVDARAERLAALGPRVVHRVQADGYDDGFVWMEDPEGHEFCLDGAGAPAGPGSRSCPGVPPDLTALR